MLHCLHDLRHDFNYFFSPAGLLSFLNFLRNCFNSLFSNSLSFLALSKVFDCREFLKIVKSSKSFLKSLSFTKFFKFFEFFQYLNFPNFPNIPRLLKSLNFFNAFNFLVFNKRNHTPAFSLVELMILLVAISVLLAAFAPIVAKKLNPAVSSLSSTTLIKTDECLELINSNCILCDTSTLECLSCDIESCSSGKTLNFEKCVCE